MSYLTISQEILNDHKSKIQVFNIFREWIRVAQLPTDFVIKDETHIIEDFNTSFIKAIKSLSNHKEINSCSTYNQGWSFGFIAGFISSNLGGKWSYQYRPPYMEEFLYHKTIQQLFTVLKFDEIKSFHFNQGMKDLIENSYPNVNVDLLDNDYLKKFNDKNSKDLFDLLSNNVEIHIPTKCIEEELKCLDMYKLLYHLLN